MNARNGTHPVTRKKFVLIEQIAQYAPQPLARGDGQEPLNPVAVLAGFHVGNMTRQVFSIIQKPLHPFGKSREPSDHLRIEHLARDERQEPDHRADAEGKSLPIDTELVVVKAVLLVPQAGAAKTIHRVRNRHEMLEKFRRHVFIRRVSFGKFERDGQHRRAIKGHPRSAIGLFQVAARGQRFRAIEHADVVQTEEAARKNVFAFDILAIHPPRKIQQQLLKNARQEMAVARAFRARDLIDAPCSPRMNGRIHVVEREFVRGQLSIGMHVPFAHKEHELLLGEIGINAGKGDHVEREVPGGVPRVLPFVRHRDDIPVEQVQPIPIAAFPAACRWRRVGRVALKPVFHDVVVELLRHHQPGVSLADDKSFFR